MTLLDWLKLPKEMWKPAAAAFKDSPELETALEIERQISSLETSLAEREAELTDWKESVKTIMETSCRADEKHCTCVPLLRAKVKETEENYEDMITRRLEAEVKVCKNCNGQRWVCENHSNKPWNEGEPGCCGGAGSPCPECNPANYKARIAELESTVARLTKALESVNRSIENGEGIDVNIVQEALSPSPSANSGEKPWTQEEIDSAKKRAAVKVANFAIDPPGFSELELLRELEIEVKEYLNLGFTNGRKIIGKLDALRKSVSPGGIA